MKIRIDDKVFDSQKHDIAIYPLDADEKRKIKSMEGVDAFVASPMADKVVINVHHLDGFFREINQKREACIKIVEDAISDKDFLYHCCRDLLNLGLDSDNVFDVIDFTSRRKIELVEDIRVFHDVDSNSAIFILGELKNRISESDEISDSVFGRKTVG